MTVVSCLSTASAVKAQQAGEFKKGKLLFKDDFQQTLDSNLWIAEIAPRQHSVVHTSNGRLMLDTRGGVTVWLNKRLSGNILIEYKRKVVVEGKENDRLSDLNQFWMAQDPRNSHLFTRTGVFEEYDSLSLYYAGMGGNTNKTTRFRKYEGNGTKPLLQEYKDAAHLLQKGREYVIRTIVKDGVTSFWVDDVCYFKYTDPAPLKEGYFGFRSTWSRQEISDFRVYQLR